jgi:hypothetical protein
MKPVIIFCVMALWTVPLEAQQKKAIYFNHVGDQDWSFAVIVINTERDELDLSIENGVVFYEYCKVSDPVFGEIKTFIQESRQVVRILDRRGYEHGSFEIVIEELEEKNSYYVQGGEFSRQFFYELIKQLSKREGLERLVTELDRKYFRPLIY